MSYGNFRKITALTWCGIALLRQIVAIERK
jgi:hypothetical protein